MSAVQDSSPRQTDAFADLLARYAVSGPVDIVADKLDRLNTIVIDSMAVALAALKHPAAIGVRHYAEAFSSNAAACAIWGTSWRVNTEVAALANGVLLRCHDYNDLYLGQKSWGHPSDIIPAVWACAEQRDASGQAFLEALALGYDVTLALFDLLPAAAVGWDYSNLTQLGAVCAIARLSGFSMETTREALAIAAISHMASDEIESGDLNDRGDLTMWKRLNAGDAMRQAVYACALAEAGVEGAIRPFLGKDGLLRKLAVQEAPIEKLRERLECGVRLDRIDSVVLKRWPVGSRAQATIKACVELRQKIANTEDIAKVCVITDADAYQHLVKSRPHAWAPFSRETADHSLVYIAACALLDGAVDSGSFSRARVLDPLLQSFLQRIEVTVRQGSTESGVQSAVRVVLSDGREIESTQAAFSKDSSMNAEAIRAKFFENALKRMTPEKAEESYRQLSSLRNIGRLSSIMRGLRIADEAGLKTQPEM